MLLIKLIFVLSAIATGSIVALSVQLLNLSPFFNAAPTLSPLEVQVGAGATSAPSTSAQVYDGVGYTIEIPSGLIFNGIVADQSSASWISPGMDEKIGVEWDKNSPDSYLRRTYDFDVSGNAPNPIGSIISHPMIEGAASSTMIQTPVYPNRPSGVYLWLLGDNGNVYSFYGLSTTPSGRAVVKSALDSVSLHSF
jgi:hypothetical protein